MAKPRRLLVPVDGSPPSLAALDHAIALAEDSEATIDLLHIEPPAGAARSSETSLAPAAQAQLARDLDEAIARAQDALGARVTRRFATGEPLRKIVELASEGGYDLLVIGTHGRVGRIHELLGSVAEGVVRSAPCPVLTVRDEDGGYQSFAERRHGRPSLAEQWPPR